MSWDSYRDTITGSGAASKAAVVGVEGGVWSATPGLNITPEEIRGLLDGLNTKGKPFQEGGVIIGGEKYMYLQSDETQVQGKRGSTGVSVAKAGKCIIIGIYGDGQQPGNCRLNVEKIRDYLQSVGY